MSRPNDGHEETGGEEPLIEPVTNDQRDRDRLVRQAELIISNVLRGGVLLSAAIILLGVVLFYARAAATGHTPAITSYPTSLPAVWRGLTQGDALAIISVGLLILLATPVVRVAVSIVAFALEGDRRYVIITTLVLLILLASFILGKAGA